MTEYIKLVNRLEDDLEKVAEILLKNQGDYALECAYVRTLFSSLEGILFAFRQEVIESSNFKTLFGVPEQAKILERGYHQPSNTIKKEVKRLNFKKAVKCSCRSLAKVRGIDPDGLPFNCQEWVNVIEANKIRDKITHPKVVADLELGNDKLEIVVRAKIWLKSDVFSKLVT